MAALPRHRAHRPLRRGRARRRARADARGVPPGPLGRLPSRPSPGSRRWRPSSSSASARTRSTPATPWWSPTTSSRCRSRPPGLSTFGTNHLDGRVGAAHRPRARPPVVRQQRDRRRVAPHLAARGLRLLRRVDLVGGRRRQSAAAPRRPAPPRAWPACRRTSSSAIPGRRTCSTTASTSAAPSPSTPCASRSATTSSGTLLRTWTAEHRHGAATTDDFTALAERVAGREPQRPVRPVAVGARRCRRSRERRPLDSDRGRPPADAAARDREDRPRSRRRGRGRPG